MSSRLPPTVLETPCVPFSGLCSPQGYGRQWVAGRAVRDHRRAWEVAHGPIPSGLCVLHRCDNPPCVRVDHLFLGTQLDNNRDRSAKGRSHRFNGARRGTGNPRCRLSEEDVRWVRKLGAAGRMTHAAIGACFGITGQTAGKIIRWQRW